MNDQLEYLDEIWLDSVVGLAQVEALVLLVGLSNSERAIFQSLNVMIAVDELETTTAT